MTIKRLNLKLFYKGLPFLWYEFIENVTCPLIIEILEIFFGCQLPLNNSFKIDIKIGRFLDPVYMEWGTPV